MSKIYSDTVISQNIQYRNTNSPISCILNIIIDIQTPNQLQDAKIVPFSKLKYRKIVSNLQFFIILKEFIENLY